METLSLVYAASALAGLGIIVFELVAPQGDSHDAGDGPGSMESGGELSVEDGGIDTGNAHHDAGPDDLDGSGDGKTFAAITKKDIENAGAQKGLSIALKGIKALRSMIYLSLGFGATGLFAVHALGQGIESLVSAGVGALVALGSSVTVRKLLRKELDSSLSPSDFIFEECVVEVAIAPGKLGMVTVRKYGVEARLYARFADPKASAAKGERLRIRESEAEGCIVERLDA